ncbi:hypothetical protein [Ekhidna sp.]
MKTKLISLTLFLCSMTCFGQELKFRKSDQKLIVTKGNVVRIEADSAYIISSSRALLLNEKLDELKETRLTNANLQTVNEDLLSKVKEVEKLVTKLLKRMESNAAEMDVDLEQILTDLDKNLVSMKQNNLELDKNNQNLKRQITEMDHTIDRLKKEIRGIWWGGITDKIVVGVLGIGVGLLIAAI